MGKSSLEPTLTPEEHRLYRAQLLERLFDRYRRGVPFGGLACVAIMMVSYFGPAARAPWVLMLGLGSMTTLLVSHRLSRVPWFASRPNVLIFWTSLIIAALIGLLCGRTGGFVSPAAGVLLLLWLFGSVIAPVTPLETVVDTTCHLLVVTAMIVLTAPQPGSPWMFLVISATGIGLVGAGMFLVDRANVRMFRMQRSLDAVNADLERRVDEQVAEIRARADRIDVLNAQLQQRVFERSRELEAALTRLARPARISSPPVGARLNDRFELVRRIDSGGMADVFEGFDHATRTPVAIKTIHARSFSDVSSLHRFLREARAATAVVHDGIVRTLDIDVMTDGTLFLVMELLEGETLAAWLENTSSRPVGAIARVGRILAEALAAAHAGGVVHRDIKPSNVMLTVGAPPGVKLLDFGVSKLLGPSNPPEDDARVTGSRAIVGTPAYMAPEQALGSTSAGPPADIYSLGVLLYEALTNMLPYEGIADRHFGPPMHVSRLRPELPPALARTVMRCLDHDPQGRPDGATLAGELREHEQIETELPSSPRLIDPFSSTVSGDAELRTA
jgi:serine/threonine-protein kinase